MKWAESIQPMRGPQKRRVKRLDWAVCLFNYDNYHRNRFLPSENHSSLGMHFLVPLALIVCYIQVGLCSDTEKWERQVVETAQREFTCPGVDGIYASPQQCVANYYQCLDGIAYPQTCPAGNLFDPVTFVCTSSSQASCNQKLGCSSDGLFPYPGACTDLYYVCSAGESYVQYCPDDYAFDPVTLRCVVVENASCTTSTSTKTTPTSVTTQTTPTTTASATTTGTSTTLETSPTTTETKTIPTTITVPTTTPETSSTTTTSIPSTKSTTSITTPIPSNMSTITPTTETMGPTFTATTPTTTTSASTSTVMQTTTKVTPTTSRLTTSPTMTIPVTTPTTIPTSTPTTPLATVEVTTTKHTTTPTTPITAPPVEFACSRTGHYPYSGNCGLYYVCGGGVYIVAACPDGQVFDPSIEYCENPMNVPGCETWVV